MKNAFLNALPIIANALGNTLGVQVVMNAGRASTNGKQIFLPSLETDNPVSKKLAIGYIAHEAAHVRFSDFSLDFNTPLEQMIDNILEDIRIEKEIARVYPGCRLFLAETVEGLVQSGFFAPLKGDETPVKVMQCFMLYQLRLNVLGQDAIADLAAHAETVLKDKVPEGMRIRLEALMYQVENCESEKDVLDLSRAIISMMKEEANKEEEKENQQQQADSDPNKQGNGRSQDDSRQNGGQQGGGDDLNDKDDATGNGSSDGKDSQDGQVAASASLQNGTGAVGQDASDIIKQILAAGDGEALKDTGQALEEAMGQSESHGASSAIPFQNFMVEQVASNVVDIATEMYRVTGASNALKVRAQALLQAQTLSTKRSVMAGTKLNMKNLHLAKLGGPVFQKVKNGVAVDTAIAVLVDRSISMRPRIKLATDAALATTMAFQRPNVKTAVFAFPYKKAGKEGNGVLKHWDAQPASAIETYATLGIEGETPMAEAMMGAGIALMQRPEKRKILLVNTDGDPNDNDQAKWVINLLRKSGVEVLGLGIMQDTWKLFGQNWAARVDDIDLLPSAMICMLDNIMLKKAA